jgi:prefoldin subunit 2
MINGVLTERTVEEVVPILKTNSDGLKKALEELVKQYKSKQDDMEKWKVRILPREFECCVCHAKNNEQKKNNVQVVQQPE